ncbi:hypothetical protein NUW58_g5376 [Xylaria curta]|uniref:Uncharacterized protein n=1 Tax=Xylaria curta TaxID=42375 RepID=A0ACC1P2C9_9PEZI|nr:hypothetical protein NUW58_g5376 [Xylaria curta]
MARSSKTSKVLRDKLLSDREAAKGMAMVCLLVNVGRMNTTLNFFPEMRAQLRTYHAIPSLQAHQDASAYKQLQDAPRLKSILKGAAEDRPEPHDLADFKNLNTPPRSNPVNLIFLICSQATQVAELHFPSGGEFHDLVMKTNYTSRSRAKAFLWLMWQYLESDFTEEGCDENPFGAGVDYELGLANQGVPRMEEMTADEEARENIDSPEEIAFGRDKQSHRAKIIAADQAYVVDSQTKRGSRAKLLVEESPSAAILPRIRPSKHESDLDSTRSTPPPRLSRLAMSSTVRRGGASLKYQVFDASSPAGPSSHPAEGIVPRKPRPPTAHQLAVERNRNQRVEYILDRGLRRQHHISRKTRRQEGVILRTKRRLDAMADPFIDSDEEDVRTHFSSRSVFRDRGFGGLCQLAQEEDNFGEEPASYAAAVRRANRRLKRWAGRRDLGIIQPKKRCAVVQVSDETLPDPIMEHERLANPGKGRVRKVRANGKTSVNGSLNNVNGDVAMEDADDLDDVDKELLGMDSGAEEPEATAEGKDEDEELDDVDKTLLGLDEDEDTESA